MHNSEREIGMTRIRIGLWKLAAVVIVALAVLSRPASAQNITMASAYEQLSTSKLIKQLSMLGMTDLLRAIEDEIPADDESVSALATRGRVRMGLANAMDRPEDQGKMMDEAIVLLRKASNKAETQDNIGPAELIEMYRIMLELATAMGRHRIENPNVLRLRMLLGSEDDRKTILKYTKEAVILGDYLEDKIARKLVDWQITIEIYVMYGPTLEDLQQEMKYNIAWVRLHRAMALPPGGEAFRVHAYEEGTMFFMYSVMENKAVFWTKDARRLPTFFRAAPFLTLMHWWANMQGLRLVHAGAVGTDAGAVLIAGKGGSGKSTTSLLCVLAGMHFLSDDFCLVQAGERPLVHCLNGSGKLHRDHFQQFPELAARSVDPVPDAFDKPLIFVHEHFPTQVKTSLPLRAVILPQVTGKDTTSWEPLSASTALRALTSSTMFQFSPDDGSAFRDMAAVLRGLPCFRLLLGTRTAEIPAAVRDILEHAHHA